MTVLGSTRLQIAGYTPRDDDFLQKRCHEAAGDIATRLPGAGNVTTFGPIIYTYPGFGRGFVVEREENMSEEPGREPEQPAIRDSDLIYLSIKRLEAVAEKMAKLEYDAELDRMMSSAMEMFEWVAWCMENRKVSGDGVN